MTDRWSESQHLLAAWFRERDWPFAEPVGNGRQGADITGMPGLAPEVKARINGDRLLEAMRQAADRPGLAFVIQRPRGFGPKNIELWPVTLTLGDFTKLIADAGYGSKIPQATIHVAPRPSADQHATGCLIPLSDHAVCIVPAGGQ